ncbi:MAG TPA: host attachment protein [Gammaproteobacteria bacterium]
MQNSWVLVANGSQARIFNLDEPKKSITLIKEFTHPESRMKTDKLSSDRSGHFMSSGTQGSGSFNEAIDPKSYEFERFAMELAKALDEGRAANKFGKVVLVASPHFLGLIKQNMSEQLSKAISHTIQKDYTAVTERDMLEQLKAYM